MHFTSLVHLCPLTQSCPSWRPVMLGLVQVPFPHRARNDLPAVLCKEETGKVTLAWTHRARCILPLELKLLKAWAAQKTNLYLPLLLFSQQVGIGPGPVFECVRFGINCRSPLLEHYLVSHGLIAHATSHGRGPYVTRTQIKELPYLSLSSLFLETTI